jgi:hypothetical protein
MNKQEFAELFLRCARQALASAQKQLGVPLSDDFDIELHGAGVPGELVSQRRAVDLMYVGEGLFYRIIDIGVKAVIKGKAILFVRISAHQPSSFEQTWNTPKGNGPFKIIEPTNIHVDD